MFHWCADETALALATIPMLGIIVTWLRSKFGRKNKKACHSHG